MSTTSPVEFDLVSPTGTDLISEAALDLTDSPEPAPVEQPSSAQRRRDSECSSSSYDSLDDLMHFDTTFLRAAKSPKLAVRRRLSPRHTGEKAPEVSAQPAASDGAKRRSPRLASPAGGNVVLSSCGSSLPLMVPDELTTSHADKPPQVPLPPPQVREGPAMIIVDTNPAEDFIFKGLGGGTVEFPYVVRQRQDLGDVVVMGRGRRIVLERKEVGGKSFAIAATVFWR